MSSDRHQVVIVGGGPVGLGLAIELGQRGVACAVVERHRSPQPIPKGQNLTQRTMEHFQFWEVEDAIRAAPGVHGSATIIRHPDVRRMLLVMKSQIEAMRAATYYLAGASDLSHHTDDDAALSSDQMLRVE